MNKKVRVRFAPSPTGYLHIGGLKTALINFLFAKKTGGDFILRLEDTDQKRYVSGSVESLISSLQWTGLDYQEGPKITTERPKISPEKNLKESKNYPGIIEIGNFGPYIQSERLALYKKYAQQLVERGEAYYCFCSPARLEKLRQDQSKKKIAPKYDRQCLSLTPEEIQEKIKKGDSHIIRLKIPEGKTTFQDLVFGHIEVDNSTLDDQVLLKSDGFPTYHLAVVIDDYLMKISHVIRGVEWLPSTPKHLILYEAFGWKENIPQFIHMPNMLNQDKKKLSKRRDSVSVEEFRKKGFSKEALLNYVLLLGWNPKTEQEIFSLEEMIEQFELSKLNRSGGIFDLERLTWINKEQLKKMDLERLYTETLNFLKDKDFYKKVPAERKTQEYIKKVISVERSRGENFSQLGDRGIFFFLDIHYEKKLLYWKQMTDAELSVSLKKSLILLENIEEKYWTRENIEKILLAAAENKRGELLWPLRVSLTGEKKSPSPFECAWVLGKEETLKRINQALRLI